MKIKQELPYKRMQLVQLKLAPLAEQGHAADSPCLKPNIAKILGSRKILVSGNNLKTGLTSCVKNKN